MAEISVSHSGRDKAQREWMRSLFGDTRVRAIFKEFDEYRIPPYADILGDLQRSNAVFLLLSPGVLSSEHTRNWVTFEITTALNLAKHLWIFEEIEQPTEFPIPGAHPNLTRYMPYSRTWPGLDYYARLVIRGYEDPDVLPGPILGGAAGLIPSQMTNERGFGTIVGALGGGGMILSSMPQPPKSLPVRCPYPTCGVQFELHSRVSPLP